jgi:hypothetical protein
MIRPTLLSVLLAMPYEVELKVIGKERPILLNLKSAVALPREGGIGTTNFTNFLGNHGIHRIHRRKSEVGLLHFNSGL